MMMVFSDVKAGAYTSQRYAITTWCSHKHMYNGGVCWANEEHSKEYWDGQYRAEMAELDNIKDKDEEDELEE